MKEKNRTHVRWLLVFLDVFVYFLVSVAILVLYKGTENFRLRDIFVQASCYGFMCFLCRFSGQIYHQIWRYGGVQGYIRLLITDTIAFAFSYLVLRFAFTNIQHGSFMRSLSLFSINLLATLSIRMIYRYCFKCGSGNKFASFLLSLFGVHVKHHEQGEKICVAIVGAGRVGTGLAEELISNDRGSYVPVCFIDVDREKVGRQIFGVPVYADDGDILTRLEGLDVQEVVFAIPSLEAEKRKWLYERYKNAGYKIKIYDYPVMRAAGGRMKLRDFDIEDLLFRKPVDIENDKTRDFYKGKTVLITGGGGSIGSEICRQLAKMGAGKLIILDIYENGAYDVQQELRMEYHDQLEVQIEIVSVCNRPGLERVFEMHHPQIVVMAAAHKHVPLMEHNCVEAVENNVFGTLNTVLTSIKYNVERVIMVSTDKAVNPTNIMGATKRMCEMIVQYYSTIGCKTTFSATRFGNVLGSAGSVIPLFKRQIAAGGPVTITDKRIIRYFMTIPEASQLVLQSGAMAQNGELFVLDMGEPVRIMDLAENMIRLSGMEPDVDIPIVETGLRPGEKLYEELLVKTETLSKTENELIFIERDAPVTEDEMNRKLQCLRDAVGTGDDETVREVMKQVVPTYVVNR